MKILRNGLHLLLLLPVCAGLPALASNVDEAPLGEAVERHLQTDTE